MLWLMKAFLKRLKIELAVSRTPCINIACTLYRSSADSPPHSWTLGVSVFALSVGACSAASTRAAGNYHDIESITYMQPKTLSCKHTLVAAMRSFRKTLCRG